MYAPPTGIGPAQAYYVMHRGVGRDAFVASIMQTAEKGATTLDRETAGRSPTGQGGDWQQLDPVTAYAAQALGGTGRLLHRRQHRLGGAGAEERARRSFDDAVKRLGPRRTGSIATAGRRFGRIMVVLAGPPGRCSCCSSTRSGSRCSR